MLDQLVESKSMGRESRSRAGFMLTTFVLVITLCFSAVLASLFAKDLGMGGESLELSTLVAPIQVIEETPPELVPKQQPREQTNEAKNSLPSRQTNMLQVEESQIIPDKVSVVPNTQKARQNGKFELSPDKPESNGFQGSSLANQIGNNSGTGIQNTESSPVEDSKPIEPPPAIKKTPVEPEQKKKTIVKSGGVVNGNAKFLPKPVYPAAAKAVRASGAVNVQVLIDEAGNVVSAKAVDGHTLLRAEAEKAARNAKFNPTLLTGQPVKVSGVIVYKFSM